MNIPREELWKIWCGIPVPAVIYYIVERLGARKMPEVDRKFKEIQRKLSPDGLCDKTRYYQLTVLHMIESEIMKIADDLTVTLIEPTRQAEKILLKKSYELLDNVLNQVNKHDNTEKRI